MAIDLSRLDAQHPAYATVVLDNLDVDLKNKQASLMRSYVAHRKVIVRLSKGLVTPDDIVEIDKNQHIVNAIRYALALVAIDIDAVANYMDDRVTRHRQELHQRAIERRRASAAIPDYDGIKISKCNVPDDAVDGELFVDTGFRPAVTAPIISYRDVLLAWFEGPEPLLANPDFFEVLTGDQYVA